MIRRAREPRCCGFTLVEVLLSLALGALLTTTVLALASHAYTVSRTVQHRHDQERANAWPLDLIAADLDNLVMVGDVRLTAQQVRFATVNAMHAERPVARQTVDVRYRIEQRESGFWRLIRAERPFKAEDAAWTAVVVVEDATHIGFAVYDGADWHSSWPLESPRPACALRVELERADGGPRQRVVAFNPPEWQRHDD